MVVNLGLLNLLLLLNLVFSPSGVQDCGVTVTNADFVGHVADEQLPNPVATNHPTGQQAHQCQTCIVISRISCDRVGLKASSPPTEATLMNQSLKTT